MLDTGWRTITGTVQTIFLSFWKTSRWILLLSVCIIFLSAISSIAAPYVFSRLIDQLRLDFQPDRVLVGFVLYAVLLGFSAALQNLVQYMSLITSQNLGFVSNTGFFKKLVKKTTAFFIEHNPAEILNAQTTGHQALALVTQLVTIVFIPGATQILFALIILGAFIDAQIVVIVVIYGVGFIAFTYLANQWTRRFLDKAIAASQDNAKFVGNSINMMETLRQFGSNRWIISRFAGKAAQVRDSWKKFACYRMALAAIYGLGLATQFIVTFVLLIPRYQRWHSFFG